MIGVPRVTYGDLSTAACITCEYSLAGLDPASKCPECGTPIAESIRAAPFPSMTPRDAVLLARACRLLIWSVVTPFVAGFVLVSITFVSHLNLSRQTERVVAVVGSIACAGAPVLLWTIGWICLAMVRAPGRGTGAGPITIATSFLAFAQVALICILIPLAVIDADNGIMIGLAATTPLTAILMVLAGQWRLTTLCRRSCSPGLAEGARDIFRLMLVLVAATAGAIVILFIEPIGAVLFGMLAATLLLVCGIGWLAFLGAVRRAAELTAKVAVNEPA